MSQRRRTYGGLVALSVLAAIAAAGWLAGRLGPWADGAETVVPRVRWGASKATIRDAFPVHYQSLDGNVLSAPAFTIEGEMYDAAFLFNRGNLVRVGLMLARDPSEPVDCTAAIGAARAAVEVLHGAPTSSDGPRRLRWEGPRTRIELTCSMVSGAALVYERGRFLPP